MGTRLIIKGADFVNYFDKEVEYSEKEISSFTYIGSYPNIIGGMEYPDKPSFGTLASQEGQLGMIDPIDIEGISFAELRNTYGQTSGIHAKVLDRNGDFVMDIFGTSLGIDDTISIYDFPSKSKWLFLNGHKDKAMSVKIGGYFKDNAKYDILSYTTKQDDAFLTEDGNITSSATVSGRSVIDYNVSQGETLKITGLLAVMGGQNFCIACFLNSEEEVIKSIILDCPNTAGNKYGMISTTVPDGATILRCNVNRNAYPKAYKVTFK